MPLSSSEEWWGEHRFAVGAGGDEAQKQVTDAGRALPAAYDRGPREDWRAVAREVDEVPGPAYVWRGYVGDNTWRLRRARG